MSYKFKSLLYFSCFVAVSIAYYNIGQQSNEKAMEANEVVQVETTSWTASEATTK